jgi:hypothetical protein
MCFYSEESPSFCSNEIRKARKDHKCDFCGKPILKGQQYECATGKWDDGLSVSKICNLCYQDVLTIVRHEIEEGCDWEDSWPSSGDDIGEWFYEQDDPPARATVPIDIKAADKALRDWHDERLKTVGAT